MVEEEREVSRRTFKKSALRRASCSGVRSLAGGSSSARRGEVVRGRSARGGKRTTHLLVEERLPPPLLLVAARRPHPGTPSCRQAASQPPARPSL